MFLSSMLLAEMTTLIVPALVVIAVISCLIGFAVGFNKGVRKVSASGFVWMLAVVGFFTIRKFVPDLNDLLVAVACVIVALLLNGIMVGITPKSKQKYSDYKNFKRFGSKAPHDEIVYDKYDHLVAGDYVMVDKGAIPGLLGRIFGGFSAVLNVVRVLLTILVPVIFIVSEIEALAGATTALMNVEMLGLNMMAAALDAVIMGILISMGCRGFKKGLIKILYEILVKLGWVVSIAVAVAIPFVLMPESDLVVKVTSLFDGVAIIGDFSQFIGKACVAMIMLIPACVLMAIVQWLVKKLTRMFRNIGFFRFFDNAIGCVVYALIGLALVMFVFYALNLAGGVVPGLANVFASVKSSVLVSALAGVLGL